MKPPNNFIELKLGFFQRNHWGPVLESLSFFVLGVLFMFWRCDVLFVLSWLWESQWTQTETFSWKWVQIWIFTWVHFFGITILNPSNLCQIFTRIFHYKPSGYWSSPISGNPVRFVAWIPLGKRTSAQLGDDLPDENHKSAIASFVHRRVLYRQNYIYMYILYIYYT